MVAVVKAQALLSEIDRRRFQLRMEREANRGAPEPCSDEVAADVEAFLSRGGQIERLPDVVAESTRRPLGEHVGKDSLL